MFAGQSGFVIIIVLVALVFFIVLFAVADFVAKRGGKAKPAKAKPEPVVVQKKNVDELTARIINDNGSVLFQDLEALIATDDTKNEEVVHEVASQRSRMHNRRARMLAFHEKYKSRTMAFESIDSNSFDEPVDNSVFASGSFNVDGLEITPDDVRKLTALHGLLSRKSEDE